MKNKVYNGKIGVKNGEKIVEGDFFKKTKRKKQFWVFEFQTFSDIFQTFSDNFQTHSDA